MSALLAWFFPRLHARWSGPTNASPAESLPYLNAHRNSAVRRYISSSCRACAAGRALAWWPMSNPSFREAGAACRSLVKPRQAGTPSECAVLEHAGNGRCLACVRHAVPFLRLAIAMFGFTPIGSHMLQWISWLRSSGKFLTTDQSPGRTFASCEPFAPPS